VSIKTYKILILETPKLHDNVVVFNMKINEIITIKTFYS